jgi:hypothetical protein
MASSFVILLAACCLVQLAASAKDLNTARPVERSLIATSSSITIEEEIHCVDSGKREVDYCEVRCPHVGGSLAISVAMTQVRNQSTALTR